MLWSLYLAYAVGSLVVVIYHAVLGTNQDRVSPYTIELVIHGTIDKGNDPVSIPNCSRVMIVPTTNYDHAVACPKRHTWSLLYVRPTG